MKRSTEMTLEKVFDRYRWPPDDMIAGICELHREMSPGQASSSVQLPLELPAP